MTEDPSRSNRQVPVPRPGDASASYPLGAPGQFGLGQPWQAPHQADGDDDDVIDLRELWRMVLKHKWLLLSIAVAGLLAALLVSFVRTPL